MEFYLFFPYRIKHGEHAISILFESCITHAIKRYLDSNGFDTDDATNKLFIAWDMTRDYNDFTRIYFEVCVLDTGYVQGVVTWHSEKELSILPSVEIFDEADVIFKVETGDLEIIREKIAELKQRKYVINVKPIHYILNVTHYTYDSIVFQMTFKKSAQDSMLQIAAKIWEWISAWNEESESKNRRKGVIHYGGTLSQTDYTLGYHIDLGSAGLRGLKYLLIQFNQLEGLESVMVSS